MRGGTEVHINPWLHKFRQVYMLPTALWIGITVSIGHKNTCYEKKITVNWPILWVVISVTTRWFTRMPAWYNPFSPALTIVQIHLPDTRCLESGVTSKYIRWLVVTFRWTENRTVPGFRMSQQMISESLRPPLSSLVPSGENCRCVIPPLWPRRRHSNVPFGSEYTPGM